MGYKILSKKELCPNQYEMIINGCDTQLFPNQTYKRKINLLFFSIKKWITYIYN